jgi:uncharacterized membrane protein
MHEQHYNPENWKLGIFYFNPRDKRLFVLKRHRAFGITLNFANPDSYLVMALIFFLMAFTLKA